MRRFVLLTFTGLSGCAGYSAYEPPVVDMRGVDQQKYAYDLGECTDAKKRDYPVITPGNIITKCMTEKGYTVLVGKS
ncbi:MAG: hypothetical protein QOJ84_930 [Bradyrhizobium sp.]|jgi:hypothetical protein|nr:hypothetical protein [Bradyrhizobium sp.]